MLTETKMGMLKDGVIAPERIWTASTNGKCHVGFDTPSLNYTNEYIRADLAAVQPVQVRLSIERKIGMYGAAYDGPQDARAYTYEHPPSNQHAWCIGKAASNTAKDRAGDYIDVGLSLLRHLSEQGFGVFSLNKNDALEPQPYPRDTALEIWKLANSRYPDDPVFLAAIAGVNKPHIADYERKVAKMKEDFPNGI